MARREVHVADVEPSNLRRSEPRLRRKPHQEPQRVGVVELGGEGFHLRRREEHRRQLLRAARLRRLDPRALGSATPTTSNFGLQAVPRELDGDV